ncbi:hypothetical protein KIH79_03155 [Bifidobacterium sp. 82T10]|uniref:Transposase n=1 Tax=Bifidobacterium miconis TaxID=2834435 RepID=A0ABS6WDE5_9BIFI|nr:hypothetical protein [Bifidobacterium miconis]MBW3091967.1 hypothetical protein [Bifidobacterium miconis]
MFSEADPLDSRTACGFMAQPDQCLRGTDHDSHVIDIVNIVRCAATDNRRSRPTVTILAAIGRLLP